MGASPPSLLDLRALAAAQGIEAQLAGDLEVRALQSYFGQA